MASSIPKNGQGDLTPESADENSSLLERNSEDDNRPVILHLASEVPAKKEAIQSEDLPGLQQEMEAIRGEFSKLQALLRPSGNRPVATNGKPETEADLTSAENTAQKILEKAHTRYEAIVAEAENQEMEILEAYHKKGMDITSAALNKQEIMLSEAKTKADQVISQAAKQATQLIADAKMKATQIIQEADDKKNTELASLNQEKEAFKNAINTGAEQHLQEKKKEIETQAQLILMKAKEDTENLLEEGRRFVEAERKKIDTEIAIKQALFEEDLAKKRLALEHELKIAEADHYKNILEKSREEVSDLGKKFERALIKTSRNALPPEFISLASSCFTRVFNIDPETPLAKIKPIKAGAKKKTKDTTFFIVIIALVVVLALLVIYKKQSQIASFVKGKSATTETRSHRKIQSNNRDMNRVLTGTVPGNQGMVIRPQAAVQGQPHERYRPPQGKAFLRTYTDNVLYTLNYTTTEWNPKYQQSWKKNLKQFLTKDLRLKNSTVQRILNVEGKLIKDLRAVGQKITNRTKDADIRRMRSIEAQAHTQFLLILGSRQAYERFIDFKARHFSQHALLK